MRGLPFGERHKQLPIFAVADIDSRKAHHLKEPVDIVGRHAQRQAHRYVFTAAFRHTFYIYAPFAGFAVDNIDSADVTA